MIKCPICKTDSEQEKQEYCLVCGWEFEYFFDELSSEENERYEKKIAIHQALYDKSIEPKVELREVQKSNKYLVGSLMGFVLLSGGLGWKLMEKEREFQPYSISGIIIVDELMYQNRKFTKLEYSWKDAKEYCEELHLVGYSNWRLPTRDELLKLGNIKLYNYDNWEKWYDENKHKRLRGSHGQALFVREEFVQNMEIGYYLWTSELENSFVAWYVDFEKGKVSSSRVEFSLDALCVR